MRPQTLAEAVERIEKGEPQDVMLAGFVDTFDLAPTDQDRHSSIERVPKLTGDSRLDALLRRRGSTTSSVHAEWREAFDCGLADVG